MFSPIELSRYAFETEPFINIIILTLICFLISSLKDINYISPKIEQLKNEKNRLVIEQRSNQLSNANMKSS